MQPFTGQLDTTPFTGELDAPTSNLKPFTGELDEAPKDSFKSGEAFKDTKELLPSWEDVKNWPTRIGLHLEQAAKVRAIAAKPYTTWTPADKAAMAHASDSDVQSGAGIADFLGAVPGMIAGGAHGIYEGIKEGDFSKGLETGGKTMSKVLPTSLMGQKDLQDTPEYKGVMSAATPVMDTLNAIPKGYAEAVNAAGFPNAAKQVDSAGQLGVMLGAGIAGGKGLLEGFKPKAGLDSSIKLSDRSAEPITLDKVEAPEQPLPEIDTKDLPPTIQGEDPLNVNPKETPLPVLDTPAVDTEHALPTTDVPGAPVLDAKVEGADTAPIKNEPYPELKNPNTADALESVKQDAEKLNPNKPFEEDYNNLEGAGDRSLMTKSNSFLMMDKIRQGDIGGALDHIAENHPNAQYRDLATSLANVLRGTETELHPDSFKQVGDKSWYGFFDPNTNKLGFSIRGALSPHTVLHESVHAMTSHFINGMPDSPLTKAMTDVYKQISQKKGFDKFAETVYNVKEFTAEAFSNPKFQDFLKQQNNITGWGKFKNIVKQIANTFGIKYSLEHSNAFDHVIDIGNQIKDLSTPDLKQSIMDKFNEAGMSKKQADLMATDAPKTPVSEVKTNEPIKSVMDGITGLERLDKQFNYSLPKSPEDIIPMARTAPDIPDGKLESLKRNLDAGGMFASIRHDANPIVKATYSYIDEAVKRSDQLSRDNITNQKTGLKPQLQRMTDDEFTKTHAQLMLDEGQTVRTPEQLKASGFTDKMIKFYQDFRRLDDELLKTTNETRARMNPPLEPIAARMGHVAGRFLGDFTHMVMEHIQNKDGSVTESPIMRIGGQTKWGAQKLADYIAKEHPDWHVKDQEYNPIKTGKDADRFQGFRELMNYIGKNDPVVAKALDTLDRYNRATSANLLNVQRHAMDKKAEAGGLKGSEGNKEWLDAKQNAEEGFKGHLAYMDTTYKWSEMQKAMESISKINSDPDVIAQQKNSIKWSTAYTDHALHRNQGSLANFATSILNSVGDWTGIGHTNLTKGVNFTSAFEMRNWMGFLNVPFLFKHLMLPIQKMPAMLAYVKSQGGVEGGILLNGLRSMESYGKYLVSDTRYADKFGKLDDFQKQAFEYAKKNNVFNVDLGSINGKIRTSKAFRIADTLMKADFTLPEHTIRGSGFFFYSHLLHDSGMTPEAAFNSAEHMTQDMYTNYASHEAPQGVAKGGWIGQLALQVTRYKTNEISTLGMLGRETGKVGTNASSMQKLMSNTPLMIHLASLVAFTGVNGMLAYKEADYIYSMFMKHVLGKPDNLTAMMQRNNVPDTVKNGPVSALTGIDSKIDESSLLPSLFPTTQNEISQLELAGSAIRNHDKTSVKQFGMSVIPSSMRGIVENKAYTMPPETKGAHAGSSLYLNPNTDEGRVYRTPEQQRIRNFGYHTTAEKNELDNNYSKSRLVKDNSDLAMHYLQLAKNAANENDLGEVHRLGKIYSQYKQAHDPDFVASISKHLENRHMDQSTQQMLGATGDKLGNTLKIRAGK